jgi:CBS domain-containing protein
VNVAIAAVLILFNGLPDSSRFGALEDPSVSMVERLIQANIILVLFNLVPAFPMDGGRVLRALLAMRWPRERATVIAARIGQGFAFLLMLAGFMGQPMLFLLAVFIWIAASQEARAETLYARAPRLVVADAMERGVTALGHEQSLAPGYEALISSPQDAFPVIDLEGRPVGVISRAALSASLNGDWHGRPIASLALDAPRLIAQTTPLDQAAAALGAGDGPLLAVDTAGRLVGLLTRRSFSRSFA